MGLIGSWLFCLHHGLPLTLLPPTAFLARPERWLWAIHQRRATLSAAPNFAYELCVAPDPRTRPRGSRPLLLARGPERRRAGQPRHHRALRPALRPLRLPARGHDAGLRPRRVLGGASPSPPSAAGRASTASRASPSSARAGRRPPTQAISAPSSSSRPDASCPSTRSASWTTRAATSRERVVGRLVFRGPSMTSGYYRKPGGDRRHHPPRRLARQRRPRLPADGEIHIAAGART